nr:trissin [Schistocerca gregaria]
MTRYSIVTLLLAGATLVALCAATCDFCGRECSKACGTNYFRTCCLNYLRKRSGPPGLHLELMLLPPEAGAARASAAADRLRGERERAAAAAAGRRAPGADGDADADAVQYIYSV